jgi:hypothetical protein
MAVKPMRPKRGGARRRCASIGNAAFETKEPTMSTNLPPAPNMPPPSPGTIVRLPKSPGIAVFLSFILPGVGQIYNGQPTKAFVFFFAFVGCIWGAVEAGPFPFAFLIPFTYLFCLIDAYRAADAVNARFLGGEQEKQEEPGEAPAWGVGLILLGLVLLLANLGLLDIEKLARFWPALLIILGGYFLYGSLNRRRPPTGGSSDGDPF